MELTLGSLFDGIAGFPLSASHYGITTKWASEIEAFPIKVSQKHFPDMEHLGDVTKINGADIPWVDIISFGSPCQDMSVAGKREGLGGARSGLFMEAVRIIKEMREISGGRYPRFAIWENVPGAFSSNNGNDFRAVLEEITEAEIPVPKSGKWAGSGMVRGNGREVAWRVLDAQHWGVPQRRKRIFLVADFAGECAGEILLEREGLYGNSETSGETREEVAAGVGDGVETAVPNCLTPWDVQSRCIHPENGIWPSLYGGEGGGHGYVFQEPSRINCTPDGITGTVSSKWAKGTGGPAGDEHYNLVCLNDTGGQWMDVSHNVAPTLRVEVHNHPPCVVQPQLYDMTHATEVMRAVEPGISPTLNARMGTGGNQVPVLMQPTAFNGRQDPISGSVAGALDTCLPQAQCVTTGYTASQFAKYVEGVGAPRASGGDLGGGSETLVNIGYRVRRLTPTECLRLQGCPDNWLDIEKASDSAKYKAVGNSVAVPCVEFIFSQIVKVLRRKL